MESEGPRFLYTEREQKKLRKTIARLPLSEAKGRSLCPFCLHVEARWRGSQDPKRDTTMEVRVICSQCQRRMVYELES